MRVSTFLGLGNFFFIISILFLASCSPEDKIAVEEINEDSKSDHYDFSTEKVLNSLGSFKITPYEDHIVFSEKHGEINAPLHYLNDFSNFNFNGIYKIEDINGEVFYFRFGWVKVGRGVTNFTNVKWLNTEPDFGKDEEYDIETVDIKFIQEGEVKISMIGDSQTWWQNSQPLRKYMDYYFHDFIFVGSNTDIYGYPHEGEGGNETKEVLDRFDYIPEAKFYTVLLGANDYDHGRSVDKTANNIIELFNKLSFKFPESKIIFISPFPSPNTKISEFNEELENNVLKAIEDDSQVLFFDFKMEVKKTEDWINQYFVDSFHLNDKGVDLFAKNLSSFIEDYLNSFE